jgi:hypothetical protein
MPQFHNTSFILSCLINARCVKVHAFCNDIYQKVEDKGTSTNVQGKSKDHNVFMANTLVVVLTLLTLLPKFTFNLVEVLIGRLEACKLHFKLPPHVNGKAIYSNRTNASYI